MAGACGDDGVRSLPDAPTSFDAPDPDAVHVTILIGGVPVPDHPVTFQNPDGTELATVRTDASGTASATISAGSTLTTLDLFEVRFNRPGRNVVTIMGVQPGDELTLRGDAGVGTSDLTFHYPTFTGGTSPPMYGVVTNCNNSEAGTDPATATLPVRHCQPRIDALMFVIDGLGGVEHYIAKPDQAFGDVDFSGDEWTAIPTVGTTYTNVPAEFTGVSSSRRVTSPRGPLYTCRATVTGTGSTRTSQSRCASFPGASLLDILSYRQDTTEYSVVHTITTDAPTLDVAGTQIKAPTRDLTLDVPTRTLAWTESAVGVTPDFVGVHIETTDIDWHVIAPYTGNTLALPPLLGAAAPHDLEPTDSPNPVLSVGAAMGGYSAVRRFGPNYLDVLTTEIAQILYAEYTPK